MLDNSQRGCNGNFLSSSNTKSRQGSERISETIEFPKNLVIAGNFALAVWIVLDTIGLLLYNLAAGVVFILVALIGIYGVLKFLGCLRPCYNCKKCTFGMGRLAALYFGKRSLKDYKKTYRLPVQSFTTFCSVHFQRHYCLFPQFKRSRFSKLQFQLPSW